MGKWRKRTAGIACAVLLVTLGGCAAPSTKHSPPTADPSCRLVVYTSHPEAIYTPLVQEFEERTGIWVQVVAGRSGELLERIAEETDDPQADVMFGGGVDSLSQYAQLFSPYTSEQCGEISTAAFRDAEGRWTGFSVLPLVLIYNPNLVNERDAPIAWRSLTDPKWTGRIAFADPCTSGSCYTALCTVVQLYGESFAGELVCNLAGRCLEESGEIVPRVADGTYSVGVTLESTAQKAIADGVDIAYLYPEDSTSAVADGVAISVHAPHLENARRFVDFVLSRDAQSFVCETMNRRSVRDDIEIRGQQRLENLNLIPYDVKWAAQSKTALIALWEQQYTPAGGEAE